MYYCHVFPSGTGASCIYPLLGTSLNGWRFLATEIDDEAVKFAQENVSTNDLDQKIDGTLTIMKIRQESFISGFQDMYASQWLYMYLHDKVLVMGWVVSIMCWDYNMNLKHIVSFSIPSLPSCMKH